MMKQLQGGTGFQPPAAFQPASAGHRNSAVAESADLTSYIGHLDGMDLMRWSGVVTELVGLLIESRGPAAPIGSFCEILASSGKRIRTQVVGFRNGRVLSIPLEETDGLQLGDTIIARLDDARVAVGPELLGRVIDGFGLPMDGGPRIRPRAWYDLYAAPPSPLTRAHIRDPLITGIRAIDSLLPCGLGQRVGLFGGSGVGKSTLLGAMARGNSADVTVIALIGERNREVRGFIENELGEEGRKRSVVVVATSDRPAPLRVRACHVALSVAEYFRDQGASVLFVMDSVTRLAMAQREIGLAAGEPPSQKGYTPSVFNLMPKLFERAGAFPKGSITGFFTVLVEGDDFNEPICDAVRGLLDGHIVLSRALGSAGHYPAIDVLASVSRVNQQVSTPVQLASAQKVREALATYRHSEDLIQLGAYVSGTNPKLDASIKARERMMTFLRQDSHEKSSIEETLSGLQELAQMLP
ncbi:MAG TPA: FliI/YscN family ATPase [Bryobacteraceae bacterium]|nr:FliI/YscN family ATPase [Bryobacteraceae bacterium]